MPERIGKYEVIERIGRGGMGTIFKARDPILERSVALKVLSSLEVTPELRTRFFREAQACARLSHPNIVTIYDMGEDDGRLFIVMELLEGEELRQLIARHSLLALEDKLSIIRQICDGLHYAHQRGVVHRDVKPANILLLRTGQVKILDFGIAQIAAGTQGELTRTGMIMGTLRYMAPEQVRGRADHRSDIFSVAALSYELLSGRSPFTGEDPLQILEQLRTETPPRLSEEDPGLPPELAAVVERGMQKEPGDRFADLGQMSGQLALVERALADEAERVRARVYRQRNDLEDLHKALAERTKAPLYGDPVPLPPSDERKRLAALQALEQEMAERIQAARSLLARVDALAPAIEHARQLLESGQFEDAVLEFEAILAQVPEHALALEGLAEARARVEDVRRGQLSGLLVEDARTALVDGAPALCLEILTQAAEISPALRAAPEIAALRERAEAALAAEGAVRRAREQAEGAREQVARARSIAQGQATTDAPALWSEAEARDAEAHAAFGRAAYAEAQVGFADAAAAYHRFEEAARETHHRVREATDRARQQTLEARERARVAAPEHARELWEAGETKAEEAEEALALQDFDRARSLFTEAEALYRRAETAAEEARDRERRAAEEARRGQRHEAEQARETAALARRAAAAVHAATYAREEWRAGESAEAQASAALSREEYSTARSLLADARRRYAVATQAATIAAEAEARRADAMMGDARRLLAVGDAAGCLRRLDQVLALRPDHAAATALRIEVADRLRQSEVAPQGATLKVSDHGDRPADDRLGDTVVQMPTVAGVPAIPAEAPTEFVKAKGMVSEGSARASAIDRAGSTGASRRPGATARETRGAWVRRARHVAIGAGAVAAIVIGILYWQQPATPRGSPPDQQATTESNANLVRREAIDELRNRLGLVRDEAARAGAEKLAPTQFAAALTKAQEGDLALGQRDMATAQQRYREAIEAFGLARGEAERSGSLARAESEARGAESRADEARRAAEAAGAPRLAQALWAKASSAQRQAGEALRQRAFDQARSLFGDAAETYQEARKAASSISASSTSPPSTPGPSTSAVPPGKPDPKSPPARERDKGESASVGPSGAREDAEQARLRMTAAKRAAEQAAAGFFAHKRFTSAQGKERDGMAALGLPAYGTAIRLFAEAQSEYQAAVQEARQEAERDRQLAPLKSGLEQAHGAAAARRQQALAAEADHLARDVFDQAQARQVEGDGLANRQDLAAAAQAYRDAADRYGEATLRARAARAAK